MRLLVPYSRPRTPVVDVCVVSPDVLATGRGYGAVLEMPCHSLSAPFRPVWAASLARLYTHASPQVSGIRSCCQLTTISSRRRQVAASVDAVARRAAAAEARAEPPTS